ncbi:hypothetical protein OHA77_29515 [Streptosporangium sp. NBC_01639]|uniref:hypothetical protein n=1 Tax=Streptosporangium sp. NBC_01639 TaxID=2975948 RepID=UPI0038697B35|nr:hypothetical protein OHA77_29515 [Streptosporangium sp. NBC_01639]
MISRHTVSYGGLLLLGRRIAFLTACGFSLLGALVAAFGLRSRRSAPVLTA